MLAVFFLSRLCVPLPDLFCMETADTGLFPSLLLISPIDSVTVAMLSYARNVREMNHC